MERERKWREIREHVHALSAMTATMCQSSFLVSSWFTQSGISLIIPLPFFFLIFISNQKKKVGKNSWNLMTYNWRTGVLCTLSVQIHDQDSSPKHIWATQSLSVSLWFPETSVQTLWWVLFLFVFLVSFWLEVCQMLYLLYLCNSLKVVGLF